MDDCAIHGGKEDTAADTERALRRKIYRLNNLLIRIREDLDQRADMALSTSVNLSDGLYAELSDVTTNAAREMEGYEQLPTKRSD